MATRIDNSTGEDTTDDMVSENIVDMATAVALEMEEKRRREEASHSVFLYLPLKNLYYLT